MKTLLCLLSLLFPLTLFGQAVSRTELGNTNALIRAQHVRTFDTISDMTNSPAVTNMNYAKAYSSTNGIGGGFFELMHTNGLVVNFGTIWPSRIPKKFLVRVYSGPLHATWFGAVPGDGIDDYLALQAWLNQMTNISGTAYLPAFVGNFNDYETTNSLIVTNPSVSFAFTIEGGQAMSTGPVSPYIKYTGPATTNAVFRGVGLNNVQFKNIGFNANSLAKYAVQLDALNGEAINGPGSSGVLFDGCLFTGTVGAGSSSVVLSHAGAPAVQVSEVSFRNCFFSGTAGSDHGFKNLTGSNCKNFSFYNCRSLGYTNAFYFEGGSSLVRFDNMIGGASITNITAIGCQLDVTGWYDEASGFFLNLVSSGLNAASARISSLEWHGAALTGSDDTLITVQGALELSHSILDNGRTASSVPNIVVVHPNVLGTPTPGSAYSHGNFFYNATVPPFYGLDASATNNWLGFRFGFNDSVTFSDATYGNYSSTNIALISENDTGGAVGALVKLKPIQPTGGNRTLDFLNVYGSLVAFGNHAYLPSVNSNTNDAGAVASLRVNSIGQVSVGPLGGGSGEINTGSNLGGGLNTYNSKSGVDLRFNTFSNAGDGITINSNANLFTINVDWGKVMSQTNATAMSNAIVALITGGVAAGDSGAVQFNQGDAFAGTNEFRFDRTNRVFYVPGSIFLSNTSAGVSFRRATADGGSTHSDTWEHAGLVSFSFLGTSNLLRWVPDIGSSGPDFIRAERANRSLTFGAAGGGASLNDITNNARAVFKSNVVFEADVAFNGNLQVNTLTVISNTTEFAAAAYVKHDLQTQGDRLVLTNSMTGNMVLSVTNVAGTTNSSFHFVFEGEAAGGTGRFITNTVNSIGNTIPVLLHNGTNAPVVSPLVWSVPAGTILEADLLVTFSRGTNRAIFYTNLLTR